MKITICGSTRFKDEFFRANEVLTRRGHICYSVAFFGHADNMKLEEWDKSVLDLVHLAKILESDAIAVVNPENYIGESTRREIAWAKILGKQVYYLYDDIKAYFPEIENLIDTDL